MIVDTMPCAASGRPGRRVYQDILRAGDTPVVRRLDRAGRSLRDLIARMGYFKERRVGLRSPLGSIDTAALPTEVVRAFVRAEPTSGSPPCVAGAARAGVGRCTTPTIVPWP